LAALRTDRGADDFGGAFLPGLGAAFFAVVVFVAGDFLAGAFVAGAFLAGGFLRVVADALTDGVDFLAEAGSDGESVACRVPRAPFAVVSARPVPSADTIFFFAMDAPQSWMPGLTPGGCDVMTSATHVAMKSPARVAADLACLILLPTEIPSTDHPNG
jgi:hypothetical protein